MRPNGCENRYKNKLQDVSVKHLNKNVNSQFISYLQLIYRDYI